MAGWDQALTALVSERGGVLKRYAFLLCGDDDGAEDLVQDALVRALARPFMGRDPAEIEGYVRRIMVNLSIDRHRRLTRWRRFVPMLAVRDSDQDRTTEVADRRDVRAALAGLSPRQRACVVLRFYSDLPVAEIAAAVGCSQGAVKRYLSEALAKLAVVFDRPGEDMSWQSIRN